MRRVLNPLLVICVICGILLPKVAMAVALTTGSLTTITICTGYELKTITLDARGEPVSETTSKSDPCTLNFADLPAANTPTTWEQAQFAWLSKSSLFKAPDVERSDTARLPPTRAPPV